MIDDDGKDQELLDWVMFVAQERKFVIFATKKELGLTFRLKVTASEGTNSLSIKFKINVSNYPPIL